MTLFGSPAAYRVIDFVYSGVYFFVILTYLAIFFSLLPARKRLVFFSAYTTIWIVGAVLYLAIPSWGPVFIDPSVFEPALKHMPATVAVQSILYGEISSLVHHPLGRRIVRFGCVAAFPSLHLSVSLMFTIASRWLSKRWFRWNLLLVGFMLVGSVVTGYHYLIDGWVGMILTVVVWWLYCRLYGVTFWGERRGDQ